VSVSLKTYTNRYLIIAILAIIAIWALLFYAILMDEVYDNIDDGLKNQKIEIIREAYNNPGFIDESRQFGINQFRILPAKPGDLIDENIFHNELVFMPYDEEEEPYRILNTGFYTKNGTAYKLEIRTSTVEEDDFLFNLAASLSVLYLVIVLSCIVINYLVLNKALKPFNQILIGLRNYRFGTIKSFPPVESQVREFEDLNTHIIHMINRNEQLFEQQKRFIENASHELQTPLAVTISKLDLLLENQLLEEEPLSKIADAKRSLLRLVSLNKSLLTLSRIENKQYDQSREISFSTLIHQLLDDYQELIEHKGLKLELIDKGDFVIGYNSDLALILLSNLLRNAIRYNIEGGLIQIFVERDKVEIRNTSPGEALNPNYIFDRFHKGRQDSQSNGLGLSIVRSIVDNYPSLKISYSYQDNAHVFSLEKS